MKKFVYSETKDPVERFGVPVGSYIARFTGTEEREDLDMSKFGRKGVQHRMAWLFTVVEPAGMRGAKFAQETGDSPGAKTTFSKVLKGILGRTPVKGEEIDLSMYEGRQYKVEVEVNPESEKGNLHIGFMAPLSAGPTASVPPPVPAPVAPPRPPAPPTTAPKPPPKPVPPPGTEAPPEPSYWALDGSETVLVTGSQVREAVQRGQMKSTAPLMRQNQEGGWLTVHDFGLDTKDNGQPF